MHRILFPLLSLFLAISVSAAERIPVILDTDIGDDIDDTWALVMMLRNPNFDVKLVVTEYGKSEYRAKLCCKLLAAAGRTEVPVGLGAGGRGGDGGQQAWVQDYKLSDYKGKVHDDGVQALIDLVKSSEKPITILAIGPTPTLAAALKRSPEIAARANLVGMQGSVRVGYGRGKPPEAEWNVKADIPASKIALAAKWNHARITPLDTCGQVQLTGARFAQLKQSKDPLVQTMLENYRIWAKKKDLAELTASSTLFDTVAIALADPANDGMYTLEDLKISVNDKGFTTIDPAGLPMTVASAWKDKEAYLDYLVKVIEGK